MCLPLAIRGKMPASSFDEEAVPTGESLLPRFDDKGRLYTYTLTETINGDDTDAGNAGVGEHLYLSSGQTFTNSYNKTGDGQLSVRKYLNVPAGRRYIPLSNLS